MCGIAGVIEKHTNASHEKLKKMASDMVCQLSHRGPDAMGEWVDAKAGIAMAHCRLAILDLTPTGAQPMVSKNGRYVIVFNGEIYNFSEIRQKLQATGIIFRGRSDTEVVLEAFSAWGVESSLKEFAGMFAIALWDRYNKELFLVRDRIGEKPLYYGWAGSGFLFASELKALTSYPHWIGDINLDALILYFKYQYIPAPWSIYKDIRKLQPGSLIKLPISKLQPGYFPEPQVYWSALEVAKTGCQNRFSGTDAEAIDHLEGLLKKVVAEQMIADVPLGAFLSGGIDSSTIVALMQAQSINPVKTFTIGFEEVAYDEARYAAPIAKHLATEHTEIYLSARDALEVIPLLPQVYDEPFADSSQIPTFMVSRMARDHVKVSLSGDGGDEVFCGYNRIVRVQQIWNLVQNIPKSIRAGLATILQLMPASFYERALKKKKIGVLADQVQKLAMILPLNEPEVMYQRLTILWDRAEKLIPNGNSTNTLLGDLESWPALPKAIDRMMFVEFVTSLPDNMLVKLDRAAMAVGLETRIPFLDHRVVDFVWHLPNTMKLRNGVGKWILRKILDHYVPQKLFERPKSGFDIPIDGWLRGPLRDWAEDLLNSKRLREDGYLDPLLVKKLWQEHQRGQRKCQYQLWAVLMFQAWLDSIR